MRTETFDAGSNSVAIPEQGTRTLTLGVSQEMISTAPTSGSSRRWPIICTSGCVTTISYLVMNIQPLESKIFPSGCIKTRGWGTCYFPNDHSHAVDEICSAFELKPSWSEIFQYILVSILLDGVSLHGLATLLPFYSQDVASLNLLHEAIRLIGCLS